MKKNKKILMIGTAITSVVAPIATVVSCGSDSNNNSGTPDNPKPKTNSVPASKIAPIVKPDLLNVVLTKTTYKDYTSYNKKTGELIIKEGVTRITSLFSNGYMPDPKNPKHVEKITSLKLPSTLQRIDDWAFNSSALTSLTLPEGVTTIGAHAFGGAQLTSLNIPASVTAIGAEAFGMSKLDSLTFADNSALQIIGEGAFKSAFDIGNLVLPDSVTNIGASAFESALLTGLTIPNSIAGIALIGTNAFKSISDTSSTIVYLPTTFMNYDSDLTRIMGAHYNITFVRT